MSAVYKPRSVGLASGAQDSETDASESLIDRHSHFNGVYRTTHDLRVEGSAEGEIECDGTLIVAPDAHIDAKVRARNVVIAGAASGEIMCDERFTLRPSGQMRGQVLAASLVVEEGAFFEGEFQMSEASGAQEGRGVSSSSLDFTTARANLTKSLNGEAEAERTHQDTASESAMASEGVASTSLAASAAEENDTLNDE